MTDPYGFKVEQPTVAPTVDMPIVKQATSRSIVKDLIEIDLNAWKLLPEDIKNLLLDQPNKFLLSYDGSHIPSIIYNKLKITYNTEVCFWRLV
jgi:hypothetical protein